MVFRTRRTAARPASRSAGLFLRMSLDEREQLHALARRRGMTATDYVLGLVAADLERVQASDRARRTVEGGL